jgi:hypothetical protein
MAHSDWIPTREQDLVDLCEKWMVILADSAKITAYNWDQAECTEVSGWISAFLTARTAYETDNSTAKRLAKDEAKGEAIDAMREFANSSIRFNKKMPDEDKLVMGIRPADTTPTTHPVPTSQPETVVENTVNHFEHKIRALNRGRNDASKPTDAYGVRYAWQVGGRKVGFRCGLAQDEIQPENKPCCNPRRSGQGKDGVVYAVCYENGKGDTGPWSPVEETVIG